MAILVCQELRPYVTEFIVLNIKDFEVKKLSECDPSWDFHPRVPASAYLPALAINGFLLNGFGLPEDHPVHNLKKPADPVVLFKELYPKVTWPELVRFSTRPRVKDFFVVSKLMSAFGFGEDDHWQKAASIISNWPLDFQHYVGDKELRPAELNTLGSLSTEQQLNLVSALIQTQVSRSHFSQLAEICTELILIGHSEKKINSILKNQNALTELKTVRYPQTSQKDQETSQLFKSFHWPKGIQTKPLRQGDTFGLEIKFFAKSPAEMSKILKALESTSEQWKKNESEQSV